MLVLVLLLLLLLLVLALLRLVLAPLLRLQPLAPLLLLLAPLLRLRPLAPPLLLLRLLRLLQRHLPMLHEAREDLRRHLKHLVRRQLDDLRRRVPHLRQPRRDQARCQTLLVGAGRGNVQEQPRQFDEMRPQPLAGLRVEMRRVPEAHEPSHRQAAATHPLRGAHSPIRLQRLPARAATAIAEVVAADVHPPPQASTATGQGDDVRDRQRRRQQPSAEMRWPVWLAWRFSPDQGWQQGLTALTSMVRAQKPATI